MAIASIHEGRSSADECNAAFKKIYVCMDNYHLSASNLTTAATTAIVNYKKNSSLDASKCIFCAAKFFLLHFYTANLKTIEFAPSCDLGFCTG
jgi:hypothetical protein